MSQPVRVLVAEDNEDHLFFIVRALRGITDVTFEIDSVQDGADALDYLYRRGQHAHRERPHLILLDLKMPRVHGLEVLEVLKNDPELRSIPITVLTSSERQQDVDASYRAGSNSYVLKRPSFAELRVLVQAMCDYWTGVAVLPAPPG